MPLGDFKIPVDGIVETTVDAWNRNFLETIYMVATCQPHWLTLKMEKKHLGLLCN